MHVRDQRRGSGMGTGSGDGHGVVLGIGSLAMFMGARMVPDEHMHPHRGPKLTYGIEFRDPMALN